MLDKQQSEINRLRMLGEDETMLSMSLVMGYKRIIKELIETIDNLLIAIELEADYPGERSREEITNAKAIVKELIDLGHK